MFSKVDCTPTALTAGGGKEKVRPSHNALSCFISLIVSEVPVELAFGLLVSLLHLFRVTLTKKAKIMTSSESMHETRGMLV